MDRCCNASTFAARDLPAAATPRRVSSWHSNSRVRTALAVLVVVAVGASTALLAAEHAILNAQHNPSGAIAARNQVFSSNGQLGPDNGPERGLIHGFGPRPAAPTATATATPASPTGAATRQPSATRAPAVASSRPHVMVIMEENKGYKATLGTCASDPYYCSLAAGYATATSWFAISHPSAPNYVAVTSGSTQGLSSDCTPPGCGPFGVTSLGGQLTAAGIPWRAYMESMPSPCYSTGSSGAYAEKHNPFLYYTDVRNAANCATVDQPYPGAAGLVAALNGAGAPDFVWITPNLLNDMHDGTVQQGDAWLQANLAPVLASPWFTGGNATVIVTMDENDSQSTPGGGQIPTVVISSRARGVGAVSTAGNLYGTLRSIEETYRLGLLGNAASAASGDLSSLFGGPAA